MLVCPRALVMDAANERPGFFKKFFKTMISYPLTADVLKVEVIVLDVFIHETVWLVQKPIRKQSLTILRDRTGV
jgi:hypothetical protein